MAKVKLPTQLRDAGHTVRILDLNAPEVIIRNENRMLQQSRDIQRSGRCRDPQR